MTRLTTTLRIAATAGLLAAALAGPAGAQGRGQGPPPGRGPAAGAGARVPALLRDTIAEAGPIDLLLSRRQELGLDALQVRRLEAIGSALQAQNRPLLRALLESRRDLQPLRGIHPRDMTPEQRALFARHAPRARPLLQQLQRNNVAAMNRVGLVLTPEQKRLVREWLEESGLLDEPPAGPLRQRLRQGWQWDGPPA